MFPYPPDIANKLSAHVQSCFPGPLSNHEVCDNHEVIIAAARKVGNKTGGVLRSEDGGKTWKKLTPDTAHSDFWTCAVDPQNPRRMYAGESSGAGVWRTTNGGQNWTAINDGLGDLRVYSLAIDPHNPKIIWAGTENGGVFRMVQSN